MGDEEANSWLFSLIITIFTGIFFTQPTEVNNSSTLNLKFF